MRSLRSSIVSVVAVACASAPTVEPTTSVRVEPMPPAASSPTPLPALPPMVTGPTIVDAKTPRLTTLTAVQIVVRQLARKFRLA